MKQYPQGFPHFETEEEFQQLLLEALDDPRPGIVMGSAEWDQFMNELKQGTHPEKLAS